MLAAPRSSPLHNGPVSCLSDMPRPFPILASARLCVLFLPGRFFPGSLPVEFFASGPHPSATRGGTWILKLSLPPPPSQHLLEVVSVICVYLFTCLCVPPPPITRTQGQEMGLIYASAPRSPHSTWHIVNTRADSLLRTQGWRESACHQTGLHGGNMGSSWLGFVEAAQAKGWPGDHQARSHLGAE